MQNRIRRSWLGAFSLLCFSLLFLACPMPTLEVPATGLSSDAYLSALAIQVDGSPISLSPGFSSATYTYVANVATGTSEVELVASARDAGATLSGAGVLSLNPAGSSTNASIVVTAENGTTTKTYALEIKRAALGASAEARLSSLSLSYVGDPVPLSPSFSSNTFAYETAGDMPNEVNYLTLSAQAMDAGATVSGAGSRALAVGLNTFEVTVTAANGVDQRVYSIEVERYAPESSLLSSLSASPLVFVFDPDEQTYTLNAPNETASVTIEATPEYPGSNLTISTNGGWDFYPFSGSQVVALDVGVTKEISIQVESQYTGDFSLYNLVVTRAAQDESTDADLISLGLEMDGLGFDLNESFDPALTSYTADLPSNCHYIDVLAVASDTSGASVSVSGGETLFEGVNTIEVLVTAAAGNTKTYTIEVTKASPPGITIASPVADAIIGTTTLTVSGSVSDPNGEVGSIQVDFGDPSNGIAASFDGNAFTANLDISGATNGTKTIHVVALDIYGSETPLALASRTLTYTAGVPGYTVTLTIEAGSLSVDGYILAFLEDASNGMVGLAYGIPVSADDFPLEYVFEGIPNGEYEPHFSVHDSPDPFTSSPLFYAVPDPVVVDAADIYGGSAILTSTN